MLLKKGMIGNSVIEWQEFLYNQGFTIVGSADGIFGSNTELATKQFQSKYSIEADGIAGKDTFREAEILGFIRLAIKAIPEGELISKEDFAYIMKTAKKSDIETYHQPLNDIMSKYKINTPLRICHFLAQLAHESGSLKYKEEIASGSAYEGRGDLGNTHTGDGKKFKGHGLIQLTGRSNHQAYSDYVDDPDLMEHPERIANEPIHSVGAAGWFWAEFKKLNDEADRDDVTTITKRINGGLNGFEDRKFYLKRAKEVFEI